MCTTCGGRHRAASSSTSYKEKRQELKASSVESDQRIHLIKAAGQALAIVLVVSKYQTANTARGWQCSMTGLLYYRAHFASHNFKTFSLQFLLMLNKK
eukprot:scaffold82245_cov27-Prasinocladus_malaysianus.AAC.1